MECPHGRNELFCCECRYGRIRKEQERPRDTVDDINMRVGYRLLATFGLRIGK